MNIFEINEAKHYCNGFSASSGHSGGSLKAFISNLPSHLLRLHEGSNEFNEYRDCVLRDAERHIFLSVAQYNRALNLMVPCSSPWAQITLYYGSFYAAKALLGMFGGYVKPVETLIEVENGKINQQTLVISKNRNKISSRTNYGGSHRAFWDFYYQAFEGLRPWINDPSLKLAITPLGNNPIWQIEHRNSINYDSYHAINLATEFQNNFKPRHRTVNFPGELNTQFQITEAITCLALFYAKEFKLKTDSLDAMTPIGSRKIKIAHALQSKVHVEVLKLRNSGPVTKNIN